MAMGLIARKACKEMAMKDFQQSKNCLADVGRQWVNLQASETFFLFNNHLLWGGLHKLS